MTQKDSAQDFDPKHRMIGAIVVVILAVVLIPLVLRDREPPAPPPIAQEALPVEPVAGEEIKVAVTRLSPPTATDAAPTPSVAPPEMAPAPVPPRQSQPKPPPAEKPVPTNAAIAPPTPTATPARPEPKRASSGWVVQVGTFSNASNATRLEQKLRSGGQPVVAERVNLDSGKAVRVRVGPFPDRTAALKAQERIQRDVGVRGVVLAHP